MLARIRHPLKLVALSLLLVLAAESAVLAAAKRPHRAVRSPASDLVSTCNGTPIIMQGMECHTRPARGLPSARVDFPQRLPRGSSGYIPPVPSPSPPSVQLQRPPSVTPYAPPPINSFSDRVGQCNQSFTFNSGVGNNPVGRDAYVRSCAN
jgi:hypothetical protein